MPARPVALSIVLLLGLAISAWPEAPSEAGKEQARALVSIAQIKMDVGRLSEAQVDCDAALKLNPADDAARNLLKAVSHALVDQELNYADARLMTGDKPGAISLASKWAAQAQSSQQQARAKLILKQARSIAVADLVKVLVPDWLRQFLLSVATLAVLALLLLLVRTLWREWKRGEWYGNLTNTTKWNMRPLKELSAAAADQTGIATDAVLDALARVGHELQQPAWNPHLLLLRPTPPANFEPAIISEFRSDEMERIVIAPPAKDLRVEWELHDVHLDDAVQNLQIKTAMGLDLGSVARLLLSLAQWFNAGEPAISGVARTVPDKSVYIHLAAHGGRVQSAAVTASTEMAPGLDATELSAERVAFKFLFRMRYPELTNDQIDGLSALRQGATLFAQYAGTVPGVGEDAKARTSSLEKAAFNLSFFRASIPMHCQTACVQDDRSSLKITDDLRQAVLLAEGAAHALVGTEEERMCAIDCFRQLQDWPGSLQTAPLRQQGSYNEAIVWAQTGNAARAVLMLTELLGERAPDTIAPGGVDAALPLRETRPALPDSICFPARVARAAAFSRYDRESFSAVPECRVELIVDDAEKLIKDLDAVCSLTTLSAHDHRLLRYMYLETLRAVGHIELMRVVRSHAGSLYEYKRPTGLLRETLNDESSGRLHRAIAYLLTCEQLSPGSELYCDLAECYLLLKEYTTAEGYARHAILESDPPSERAYYIAAESLWMQDKDQSKELARKYLSDFKGTPKLEEFKALMEVAMAQPGKDAAAAGATA